MIDGENEKKEDINQPSNQAHSQNSYQEPPRNSYQEDPRPPIQEPPRGSYQQPPVKSSKKSPILIIVAIIAICCVVAGVAIFIGAIALPDWTNINTTTTTTPVDEQEYQDETIGGHLFKIPIDFERVSSAGDYIQFENDQNQIIRIAYTDEYTDLHSFARALETDLNVDGERVSIDGITAYKFSNVVDADGSAGRLTLYAVKLGENIYGITFSRDIPNPDDFLERIINS